MNAGTPDPTAPVDVRRAYRAEHVVEHLVDCIEQTLRAEHADSSAGEPPAAEVLLWHDPIEQQWVATAGLAGSEPELRAHGATEIEACRALLHMLRRSAE